MKVQIEVQIYNNEEQPDGCVLVKAEPEIGKKATIVCLEIQGETYELDADELIAAVFRATSNIKVNVS